MPRNRAHGVLRACGSARIVLVDLESKRDRASPQHESSSSFRSPASASRRRGADRRFRVAADRRKLVGVRGWARPVSDTAGPGDPAPAARQREQSQPQQSPQKRTAERAPAKTQKLLGVLAASAIVAAAAGCVLYGAMAQPIAVHAVHHPAPPPAPTTAPPPITIVATYPVEPSPSNDAHASRGPVPIAAGPIALDPVATNPGLANGASPGTDTPDASIRSLLRRYVEAYDHRDVETAAALWPRSTGTR